MWVINPPGFDKTKKYPLFLLIHGGPHNYHQRRSSAGTQVRSRGYVTGWPNFHGSSGFGQAFTDSINLQQDALPYEDDPRRAGFRRSPGSTPTGWPRAAAATAAI
jgi:dipeptidyl aminopeptidase/acylaminoacyl peptidase